MMPVHDWSCVLMMGWLINSTFMFWFEQQKPPSNVVDYCCFLAPLIEHDQTLMATTMLQQCFLGRAGRYLEQLRMDSMLSTSPQSRATSRSFVLSSQPMRILNNCALPWKTGASTAHWWGKSSIYSASFRVLFSLCWFHLEIHTGGYQQKSCLCWTCGCSWVLHCWFPIKDAMFVVFLWFLIYKFQVWAAWVGYPAWSWPPVVRH